MADLEHVKVHVSDQDDTEELPLEPIPLLIMLANRQEASKSVSLSDERAKSLFPRSNRLGHAAALSRVHVADIFLPISLALWIVGISRTNTSHLGPYGLLNVLPLVFYASVGLLVISIGSELFRAQVSRWRMAAHAVALVIILYATGPLVYPEGRYQWLYKTIGVTQYVNAHGQLDRYIDIYQNWPGFFAFTAWFDKVAGVSTPLVYAKWSQLIVELAALPLLSLCFGALSLSVKQRWLAIMIYSAANWLGQDYFSPQALGTLLSLGIMAITLRWFFSGNSAGSRRIFSEADASTVEIRVDRKPRPLARLSPLVLGAAFLLFFVLTFTHEISPYLLIAQVGILAMFGLVRPRWLPVAFTVIAISFLGPRFSFINSRYGVLQSIGDFFSNVAPPSSNAGPIPSTQQRIQYAADLLSVFIWGLALVGVWRLRHTRRTVLALAVLAFSPILVLALGAYGDEGLLRVYLFSLPWSAALASAVLIPAPTLAAGRLAAHEPGGHRWRGRFGAIRAPACLAVCVALFLPAFFGDDTSNVMSQPEVTDVTAFLSDAPGGPIYGPNLNAPFADTARYHLFPLHVIFGTYGVPGTIPTKASIAAQIARNARGITGSNQPAYVIVTQDMRAYNEAYNIVPEQSFTILLNSLAHSRDWARVLNQDGTVIYELRIKKVPPVPQLPG